MSGRFSGLLACVGVSELDEQVYRTLLVRPGVTQPALAEATGQPPRRVAVALRRLEGLGLVGHIEDRPRRFVPAMPDVAVESLVAAREQEFLQARATIQDLAAEYRIGRRDNPGELVEILTGEVEVAQRFGELQESCCEEMMLFDRPPYAAPPDNPRQASVLARGVRWRTIYAPESMHRESAHDHVQVMIDSGEEARTLPGLPMKLVIVDRRVALLPLTLETGIQQSAVIHQSTLLDAMATLFEVFWERALPVIPEHGPPPELLSDDDRRLLSMLVTGAKDEAIARELDVGVRTLGRRMQRLLQLLDAETRFQAGIQATRRGLV